MNNHLTFDEEEKIGAAIVNAAFTIHRTLGPGLLEKVYEVCLAHELQKAGYSIQRQVDIPIVYDGITFEEGLRLDLKNAIQNYFSTTKKYQGIDNQLIISKLCQSQEGIIRLVHIFQSSSNCPKVYCLYKK